jgi:hypothetical protein
MTKEELGTRPVEFKLGSRLLMLLVGIKRNREVPGTLTVHVKVRRPLQGRKAELLHVEHRKIASQGLERSPKHPCAC